MLKPIYQPSDHCRNSLRNQECAHSRKVRELLLCTSISILQVEVCETGQKVSSPSTQVTRAKTLPRPVSSCSARKRLPRPPALPMHSDPAQKSRDGSDCQQMGTSANPLHLLRGLGPVQGRRRAHSSQLTVSSRSRKENNAFRNLISSRKENISLE